MDEDIEVNVDDLADNTPLHKLRKKMVVRRPEKNAEGSAQKGGPACFDEQGLVDLMVGCDPSGSRVSMFNYSVESHLTVVDIISKFCGEAENMVLEEGIIEQLTNSISFLREWRQLNCVSRLVYFDTETPQVKGRYNNGINLPQFSAAAVPKSESISSESSSLDFRKDFVLCVGGTVWALDWCPRLDLRPGCDINTEFIAISAHPPGSPYHKLGTPLRGRGVVQIWCILNDKASQEGIPGPSKKPNQKTQRKHVAKRDETQSKRPRGRPRKNPKTMTPNNPESESHFIPALAVEFPDEVLNAPLVGEIIVYNPSSKENKGKKQRACEGVSASNVKPTCTLQRRNRKHKARVEDDKVPHLLIDNQEIDSPVVNLLEGSLKKDGTIGSVANDDSTISLAGDPIPKDIFLPRLVLCLAHDGEVAWDVKWRPHNLSDSDCKYRMGYLAVILGNGSIEVWDVPTPRTMKIIYSSQHEEDTDPRFVKLMPVFRCSMLCHGDRQSIPLTVEWSTAAPHDFILTGCHNGVVALFKFSTNDSSKDCRPLLCFSADTVPIRAMAWAPSESDAESRHVIVTAGHDGVKFWDLRDPFRPLWSPKPHEAFIYSIDWPSYPRCVITTYDDGTVRICSLKKAAYDASVTGKLTSGTKSPGEHFYNCSSFAIWSAHVSRLTGRVAYCGADGNVLHFQLTEKEVDNDARTRAPHFLCGALSEYGSAIVVNSPQGDTYYKRSKGEDASIARPGLPLVYGSVQPESESTKYNKPDSQALALRYGDEDMNQPLKTLKKKTKTRTSKPIKGAGENQVVMCREGEGEGAESANANASEKGKVDEVADNGNANGINDKGADKGNSHMKADGKPQMTFPPKAIAMHKVRWNMNRGSERWLCYGGAAGIVRCQEIITPVVDKKRHRG